MKENSLKSIQRLFVKTQFILIISLALFLGIAGTLINLHFEMDKRDQNLKNMAEAIARSPIMAREMTQSEAPATALLEYLDSLKESLDDIDVISIVNEEKIRVYHSNHDLMGTVYDGTVPEFEAHSVHSYTTNETGPSGTQRRAYAAVYDENGTYQGFVMTVMLKKNINNETIQTFFIFALITIAAVLMEALFSSELFGKIKDSLLGYEPDVFTTMYKMRDTILESLDEGILAVDNQGEIQFINHAAAEMLKGREAELGRELMGRGKEFNRSLGNGDILVDSIPIMEGEAAVGTIAILHDKAEYTKLMEDLTGTRHLVDSMRANNHDFTNKLHVILGLIQMEMYDEATSYIQNITMVQRTNISKIMNAVNEPSIAALLIGKTARASELNIHFVLREGCHYSVSDMDLPQEMLVTVIGNLLDNAFEAMNENDDYDAQKELLFGIYSRPGAVLITVDDTGSGIAPEEMDHIFEQGYSTKGEGRGTGLYQVKTLVEGLDGKITVESQEGIGTSVSVSFTMQTQEERE